MVIEIPIFKRADVIRNMLVAEIFMQQEKMMQKEVLFFKVLTEIKSKNTTVHIV